MSLVFRVTDTNRGVEARVEVEHDPDGSHRITDMRIGSADGRRLQAEDLLLLERLGLQLPAGGVGDPASRPATLAAAMAPDQIDPPGEVIPLTPPVDPPAEPARTDSPAGPQTEPVQARSGNGKPVAKKVAAAKAASRPAKAAGRAAGGAAKPAAKGAKKAAGKPAGVTRVTTTQRAGRGYRHSPPVAELQELIVKHGGPGAVAEVLGVPQHTVAGWLRRHRNPGHQFEVTATGASAATNGSASPAGPPAAVFSGAGGQ